MSKPPNKSLELHSEVLLLLEEISVLREELAERLAELHNLQHTVKPNLLAIFQTKLGPWELRLLEAMCQAARWKRKVELVQAAINRGKLPDMAAIDAALEVEFLAWQQQVREAAQKIDQAQFRLDHLLGPGDDAELKKIFYTLAKKLHPDVNPRVTSEQSALWLQVLASYESGDLQKLKALALLVDSEEIGVAEIAGDIETLRIERERLRSSLQRIFQELALIQNQPPFCHREQWEDEAWITQRRTELDMQESIARSQASALEKHLEALLMVYGTGKPSGLN
jgi:hypothetical protein